MGRRKQEEGGREGGDREREGRGGRGERGMREGGNEGGR